MVNTTILIIIGTNCIIRLNIARSPIYLPLFWKISSCSSTTTILQALHIAQSLVNRCTSIWLGCKVLIRNSVPTPTLSIKPSQVVERFVYLSSCLSAGGGVSDGINLRMMEARVAFTSLAHLGHLHNVSVVVRD